ncbi:MAG: hypothetical protein RLP15_14100, partial [Cryomorphaceae bacterium]
MNLTFVHYLNPYFGVIVAILLAHSVMGQTFTSVQSGNWEDGATWGNLSPGISGLHYPDNNDHAVISSGTVVTQNSVERPGRVWINAGGELISNATLRIGGSYWIDGVHSGVSVVRLQGNNDSILGVGSIITSTTFRV